jgi:zinc transporter
MTQPAAFEESQGSEDGLLHALELDGRGGARALGWSDLTPGTGQCWLHMDRAANRIAAWLREGSGLDAVVVDALLAEETRPRAASMPGGLLVILRGVNLNPGADPEDMISLRIWLEKHRLITLRHRRVMAVQDVRAAIAKGAGPKTPAAAATAVIRHLVTRAGVVIDDLDDGVSAAEDRLLTSAAGELRRDLREARRIAIMLRRYLAPQRDTLSRLTVDHGNVFDPAEVLLLREASDGMVRLVEDLDAARDRAALLYEELSTRLADTMNRNMYVLSVVAAIFLPLGLLTGMFGINVGGVPWLNEPLGFLYVSATLVAIGALQYWLLKKLGVL